MGQSLARIYVHIVFHVKLNKLLILPEDRPDLFAYVGSILRERDSMPIRINGVGDHIHILCSLSKKIAACDLLEDIKRHSSRWIKTRSEYYKKFAWQGGYGCFSVSPSLLEITKSYIDQQEAHHKKVTFEEELISFLKEYGLDYDIRYLFKD
ncbi:MAG: transposase [Bacteroidales bacterium]|nr:transposase [Bacteroidales bacterium]